MSSRRLLATLGGIAPLVLGALVLSAPATSAPAPASAADAVEYTVDSTHSSVLFRVKHNSVAWFYGRFNRFDGSIQYDAQDPSKCSVLLKVDAASVDSRNQKLDDHIKSPDFLDAKQFNEIVFESEKVKAGKEKGSLEVEGTLTLRGVSKPLTIQVEPTGMGEGRRGKLAGFHTRFTVDRTEFGVSYGSDGAGVGREVELTISIEANAK